MEFKVVTEVRTTKQFSNPKILKIKMKAIKNYIERTLKVTINNRLYNVWYDMDMETTGKSKITIRRKPKK